MKFQVLDYETRLVSRKELISVAEEVLQLVYEHLAVTSDEALSPDLLHLWAHYRKSSIVNGYTNKFKLWIEYCKRAGESLLPPKTLVASWLAAISLSDKTASPTDARCAAINYFSKIAGVSCLTNSHVVEITKGPIRRKLVSKNHPKFTFVRIISMI